MQCKIGGPFNSLSKTMQIVYVERDRSLRKMFYGVHVNYTRALISWVFHPFQLEPFNVAINQTIEFPGYNQCVLRAAVEFDEASRETHLSKLKKYILYVF